MRLAPTLLGPILEDLQGYRFYVRNPSARFLMLLFVSVGSLTDMNSWVLVMIAQGPNLNAQIEWL